jgi:hypothetical protein
MVRAFTEFVLSPAPGDWMDIDDPVQSDIIPRRLNVSRVGRVDCVPTQVSGIVGHIRLTSLFAFKTDPIVGARLPRAECGRNHRHAAGRADWRTFFVYTPIIE